MVTQIKQAKLFSLAISLFCLYLPHFLFGQFPIAEADKFINQGDNLFKTGNFRQAIDIYSNAIEVAPDYSLGYMKRAIVFRSQGDESMAEQDYRKAIQLNPYSEFVYDSRAKMKILATDYITFPDLGQYYFQIEEGLSFIYDGFVDTHYNLEYYSEFINNSQNFEDMNDLEYRNFLISGFDALSAQSYDNALTEIDNSLDLNQDFAISHDLRGLALAGNGEIEEAIASFDSAIALDKDLILPYYNRSMIYRISGEIEKGLTDINEALVRDDDNIYFYLARATLYKEAGDMDSSIRDFNKIISLDSTFIDAYIYRSLIYTFVGNLNQAQADIDEAIELDPQDPRLWNIRGNVNMYFEDYDLAIENYNEAIKLDVNYAKAYHNRGLALIMKLSKDQGCDDLRKAERLGYIDSIPKIQLFCRK